MNRQIVPPDQSSSALRASLLRAVDTPSRPVAEALAAIEPADQALLVPSAPELLESSPSVQRLCESYHRTQRAMIQRSRRQRLGLALLVAGVGVGSYVVGRSGTITASTLSDVVVAVAVASCISLALLALLWVRDVRRLRMAQGERLLRALQFNCALADERLQAFRRLMHPTTAFFECYAVWCSQHPETRSGFATFRNALESRHRAAA